MTGVVRWEQPPEHGNKRAAKLKYEHVAAELRKRPGKWAVVSEDMTQGSAAGFAGRIRRGEAAFAPRGSFEAHSVGPAGGKSTVYARYVGGGTS